jgi:hypothetical protein
MVWEKSKKPFEAGMVDNQHSPVIPVQPKSLTINRTANMAFCFELGSPIYPYYQSHAVLNI